MNIQRNSKTKCILLCDTRERHVLRHEKELEDITMEIKQITTGDYVVMNPNGRILAVIERKSLEDYSASIKDGRHLNKSKLHELRKQTNCRIVYIIEGPEFPDPNDCFGKIPYRYIESSIFHLMIRDGVTVMRTKDSLGTAKTLARFMVSMDSLIAKCNVEEFAGAEESEQNEQLENNAVTQDVTTLLTKKHEKTDHEIARELWSCFKGISVESADEFTKVWSIADIVRGKVDRKEISEFKLASGRKISKIAANSLQSVDKLTEVRLLQTIPMISHSTATEIANQVSLGTLLSYSIGAVSIIKVGKARRNLGEEKAKKILHYFNYKYVPNAEINENIKNAKKINQVDTEQEILIEQVNVVIDDPSVNAFLDLF